MNKKQLICMWFGIVAIALYFLAYGSAYGSWTDALRWSSVPFVIVLVTGGLIVSFRYKSGTESKARTPMNLRRGLRRITLLLSIIVALVAWCICSFCVFSSWDSERMRYSADTKSYDEIAWFWSLWDSNSARVGNERVVKEGVIQYLLDAKDGNAAVNINDETHYLNAYEVFPGIEKEMLDMPAQSLDEKAKTAKELAIKRAVKNIKTHERWGSKSRHVIISLSVLAALPAGIVGFVFVWLIYFLLRWLMLGFRTDTS